MKRPSKKLQILLAVVLLLYACGYVTQFIGNYAVWLKNGDMLGGTSPPFPSLLPLACLKGILWFPYTANGRYIRCCTEEGNRSRRSCEKKVICLARQTPLSCAEIIKCIEMGIRHLKDGYDVLDKLYDDNDLNCDNFAQAVREYRCSREVIPAITNVFSDNDEINII